MTTASTAAQGAVKGLGASNLAHLELNRNWARLLPRDVAYRERVVPLARDNEVLVVASLTATEDLLERLSRIAGCSVQAQAVFDPLDIDYGLAAIYESPQAALRLQEEAIGLNLVRLGYVGANVLREHLAGLREGASLTEMLVEARIANDSALAEAMAFTLHLPNVRLGTWPLRPPLVRILPRKFAEAYSLAPFALYRGCLLVAVATPNSLAMLREASRLTGFPVAPVVVPKGAITSIIRTAWGTVVMANAEEDSALDMLLSKGESNAPSTTLSFVEHPELSIDPEIARRVPEPMARRLGCFPLRLEGQRVVVATDAPLGPDKQETLRLFLGRPVQQTIIEPSLLRALSDYWATQDPGVTEVVWPANWWTHEEPFEGFLTTLGYVTEDQSQALRRTAGRRQAPLTRILLETGVLTEESLAEALSLWWGAPWVQIDQWLPDSEILDLMPEQYAQHHGVLPLRAAGQGLTIAVTSPDTPDLARNIMELTGMMVRFVIAAQSPITRVLRFWYNTPFHLLSEEFAAVASRLMQEDKLLPNDRTYWAQMHLQSGEEPDQTALRLGLFSEQELAESIARVLQYDFTTLAPEEQLETMISGSAGQVSSVRRVNDPVDPAVSGLLSVEDARRLGVIPLRREQTRLVVAFAWPSQRIITTVQDLVREQIRPVVARRSEIESAINRVGGHPRLGDVLLSSGLVRPDQLEAANSLAEKSGLRIGEALVSLGHVSENQLVGFLADQYGLPHFDLQVEFMDTDLVSLVPRGFVLQRQVLPLSVEEDEIVLGVVDPSDLSAISEVEQLIHRRVRPVLVAPSAFALAYQTIFHEENVQLSATQLMNRTPEDSAARVLSDGQKVFILVTLVALTFLFLWKPLGMLVASVTAVNLFYLAIAFYKFYLIFRGLGENLEIAVTPAEVATLDERDLPVYTILVPLYREASVLPTLVESLGRLDYPKAKLDVKLLLEEDDPETIAAAQAFQLPSHFQIVVVPNFPPKGKPKACNYGLLNARGTYVVIYDAEDIPEPDQLKRAILAFRKGAENLGCVQCKLNYYNHDQNLLTRWFTSEYSMWFDLFLPGLNATGAPIPLGGTSNHFPTIVLQDLGAWDPYNVTEDADLGIRLFKRGYTTSVVDSTTYEEANSEVYNWIRQRSRWVKGYIQTWLVHMRNPFSLYRAVGFHAFFSIQMTILGTFFTFLVNPIFWALTLIWFLVQWSLIRDLFPGPIYYVGAVTLFLGNFIFTYMSIMGCLYRRHYSLVKYAVFSLLYWYLMSFAAWKGIVQLLRNPFYWEKTVHGLYRGQAIDTLRGGQRLGNSQ